MPLLSVTFDFSAINSFSLIVALVGYVIVFSALVLLFFVYKNVPRIINMKVRNKLRRSGKKVFYEEDVPISGEVNAAISMALLLYFEEMHDEESDVMTIKRVSKRYSPWSSKLYSLNNYWRVK